MKKNAGFTLMEILIVSVIVVTLSLTLVLNFRFSAKDKTARTQAASIIISDIRQAESRVLSGAKFKGNFVCGFGLHYVDSTTYLIYAKAVPSGGALCSTVSTRNYLAGSDSVVDTKRVFNTGLEIRSAFADIFFEPPDPKTYINNSASLLDAPAQIIIQVKGQADCVSLPCTNINVYTSGRIDLL